VYEKNGADFRAVFASAAPARQPVLSVYLTMKEVDGFDTPLEIPIGVVESPTPTPKTSL